MSNMNVSPAFKTLSLCLLCVRAESFTTQPVNRFQTNLHFQPSHYPEYTISDVIDVVGKISSPSNLDSTIMHPSYQQMYDLASYTGDSALENSSLLEGVFFSILSHLALDFSESIVGKENTDRLDLITVTGILLAILSDYVPDHYISSESAFFQIAGLTGSLSHLFRSVYPRLQVLLSKSDSKLPSRQNVIAYHDVFEPAGISWIQFRALLRSKAIEWVEIAPGNTTQFREELIKASHENASSCDTENIDNVQISMHWYYDKNTKSIEPPDDIGLLACIQFMQKMNRGKKVNWHVPAQLQNVSINDFLDQRLLTSEHKIVQGASILRINTGNMMDMMKDCEDLFAYLLSLSFSYVRRQANDYDHHRVKQQFSASLKEPMVLQMEGVGESQDLYS